jgi:hypothetical protein
MGLVGAAQEWRGVYPADNADPVSWRDPHFMRCAAADRLMWQWVGTAVEGMAAEGMAAEGMAVAGMAATGSATPGVFDS